VNKHLYLRHLLVLSSPKLMMHGYTNLKFFVFSVLLPILLFFFCVQLWCSSGFAFLVSCSVYRSE